MKRVRCVAHGRVQGVFFRASTQEVAKQLGLRGWVRNNPDGTVEAVFEGHDEDVEKMLEWCRDGPPLARVTKLDIVEEPFVGEFADFEIRYY